MQNYDFTLDSSLIAQKPLGNRSESKFLIYDTQKDKIFHKHFFNIIDFFKQDEFIILNDSEVIPVKIFVDGKNGKIIEFLLVKEIQNNINFVDYIFLTKLSKIKDRDIFYFKDVKIEFLGWTLNLLNGIFRFHVNREKLIEYLASFGKMPLSPYIKRYKCSLEMDEFDKNRYQNVYAKALVSIVCPTAGLHFSDEILERLKNIGVKIKKLTLHVGIGTFKPIKTVNILDHEILKEKYFISDDLI